MADNRKPRGFKEKRKKAAEGGNEESRLESGCLTAAVMTASGCFPMDGPAGAAERFAQPNSPTEYIAEV